MSINEIAQAFDAIQPDADTTTATALRNPRRYSWSYVLDGVTFSCRSWSELAEVAEERRS